MTEFDISRRNFIKGGAAFAAVGGLTLAGCTSTSASSAIPDTGAVSASSAIPDTWDYETDVVVIGTGSIISAALRAHDSGLNVLVLEKHPTWFGGTTAFSGACVACPNSTQALENGIREIPREDMMTYLLGYAENRSNEDLLEMFIDNCAPAIDYLTDDCGFVWKSSRVVTGAQYDDVDSEIENSWVMIGAHEATGTTSGRALAAFGKDAIDERGIEVLMGTAATKLIYLGNPTEGDGEVVGVWAESTDGPIAIKARYGVVLGTGGFDHNQEMVKYSLNHPVYSTCAVETNTGDGLVMATELGAKTRNMDDAFWHCFNMLGKPDLYASSDPSLDDGNRSSEAQTRIWDPGWCGSIIVNRLGDRFVCEGARKQVLGRSWDAYDSGRREWANIPGYMIINSDFQGQLGQDMTSFQDYLESGELPEWLHVYDTMEELADAEGINKAKLLRTIDRWNEMCATGIDEDFARGTTSWDLNKYGRKDLVESGAIVNPCMDPFTSGPFYCVPVYPGMMTTCGGLEITPNGEVKNARGEAIPRLYAGSCCIANIMGRGYPIGGATLANGYVVGYVAANHIATLQPWDSGTNADVESEKA